MKIGLPKALLYHRYGYLWETFFRQLGCEVITSQDTNQIILANGIASSVSECCLPVKVYLGHIRELSGKCDYILVPRFERTGKNEEFCARFWGLPDIVCSTMENINILTYNLCGGKGGELSCFLDLAIKLCRSPAHGIVAYRRAKKAQEDADMSARRKQELELSSSKIKVLLAGQPYILHDGFIGAPMARMIEGQGAIPVYSDLCDRSICRMGSGTLSHDLYWTINKEIIGSIPLMKNQVDGVVLITPFPCGTDSLVNELVLRRVKDIPVTHIVLDEQQAEAGLETRIECFIDILKERRCSNAS